jgi:hypothetical protein
MTLEQAPPLAKVVTVTDERRPEVPPGAAHPRPNLDGHSGPVPLPAAALVDPSNPDRALAAVTPQARAEADTLSGHFVGISLRRAIRLNIKVDEVLPSERAHLEAQARHLRNPEQQAFLAWRRSVLLLVAIMFVPLTGFRFVEAFDGPPLPPLGRAFVLLPAIAEATFCVVAFNELKRWAQWKRQRRVMFIAWALYFVAPFLVYLYPFRYAYDGSIYQARAAAAIGGLQLGSSVRTIHLALGLAYGVQAMLALGPKIISLMPGLIRASIVSKLLFPGSTAPGWLMMLAAPLYALFAYIIVLLPYQITGSWQFLIGNFGLLFGQIYIGLSGRKLTVPLTNEDADQRIHRSWLYYIGILVVSAAFMVYGLHDVISELHLGWVRVVTGVLSVVSNVLLDTLVGTDLIVASMNHFRRKAETDPVREQLLRDAETKLDVFCA